MHVSERTCIHTKQNNNSMDISKTCFPLSLFPSQYYSSALPSYRSNLFYSILLRTSSFSLLYYLISSHLILRTSDVSFLLPVYLCVCVCVRVSVCVYLIRDLLQLRRLVYHRPKGKQMELFTTGTLWSTYMFFDFNNNSHLTSNFNFNFNFNFKSQ